jgi:hypothetical protein
MENSVRWGTGLTAIRPGVLKLENGRLSLVSEGKEVFGVGVPAPGLLRWPWYGMNASFTLHIGGQKYSVTFMPLGAQASQYQASLDTGARWKAAVEGGAPPVGGQRTWIRGVRVLAGLSWILLAFMGSLIGLAMLANPHGGPFQIYRALGGLIMLVCLARAWGRIRDFRGGNAR